MGPLSGPEILRTPQSDFKNEGALRPDDDRLRAEVFFRCIGHGGSLGCIYERITDFDPTARHV